MRQHFVLKCNGSLGISDISLDSAVYLLSFIRVTSSEDLNTFGPLASAVQRLSPTADYDHIILIHLFQKGLIQIHPDSPVEAFTFENDDPVSMYSNYIVWALFSGDDSEKTRGIINELESIFREESWPEQWNEQRSDLWKKIALYECLEYLMVVLNEHSLTLKPGEKTHLVLANVLESYSAGQVSNMIWRAGKDAAAFYMRENVTKPHAANTVVSSIQRQADRARAEKWDIKPYRRDRRCPQSVVSQVFFNNVLKVGEEGFTTCHSADIPLEENPF